MANGAKGSNHSKLNSKLLTHDSGLNMPHPIPFLTRCGGFLASGAISSWMGTLDYRALFYDRSVDPQQGCQQSRIYILWHENILMPLYMRGHCDLTMLLSRHRDADILERVAYHLGFDCVRGSTNRGATTAIRELSRRGRNMHLAITPDGPRGPRRHCAQGPIYLASKLQLPLVPLGLGYDHPWRAKSWDRFAIPRPFSRARAIMGPALTIPPHLDRTEIENCRMRTERLLTALTDEATAWAESGVRREGETTEGRHARPLQPRWQRASEAIGAAATANNSLKVLAMPSDASIKSSHRIAG